MLMINCQNVKKYNAAQLVLENVTFELHQGEKAGLVGRNGCGKTTLLRLLAKLEAPDDGMLAIAKNISIGYLQQNSGGETGTSVYAVLSLAYRELLHFRNEMSQLEVAMASPELGAEELESLLAQYAKLQERYEAEGGYELESTIDGVAEGLRIPREWYVREFQSLSGGEKTKVALASQLLLKPGLLLLDEPTNHLDMSAVEWLEDFLQKYAGSCLIVSHDRYFLDRVATKIVELEDGESTVFHGNYSRYAKEKEELILRQFADYQEQQKQIKKMKETIKQLLEWGRIGDNGKFFRRAASMQKALDRMEKVKRPAINRKEAEFELKPTERSGKQAVVFQDVEKRYGSTPVLSGISGELHYGDNVMLIGDNGSGKSTLLKLMLGELTADSGEIKLGSRVEFGYLAQQLPPDNPKQTVLHYFRSEAGMEEGEARNTLAAYLFYGTEVFKPVGMLSGGEWTRLRLALLVLKKPNLLILDEPTNHMDIASREALEEALEDYPGTLLIVTHDRYLINRLAQRIWELDRGHLEIYLGGFDDYKTERGRRKAQALPDGTGRVGKQGQSLTASVGDERKAAGGVKEHSEERRRTEAGKKQTSAALNGQQDFSSEQLEAKIEEAERRIAALDAAMEQLGQTGEAAERAEQLQQAWSEREALQESLDGWMEQWLEKQVN
ncbi:ribosomal protection-like ABC-F family protein [Paenibacillus sp. CAU 1782]